MRRPGRELFDDYLGGRRRRPSEDHEPFTPADYRHFIDGKPRYDGVRDFLASRGISLPWGTARHAGDEDTVCGLGNRKQQLFPARSPPACRSSSPPSPWCAS